MRTYIAHFKDKRIEFQADSMWAAMQHARTQFKPAKKDMWLVSVMLADVEHDGAALP
jgi:hypothetical protein